MPLEVHAQGFDVTYSRALTVFGILVALPFNVFLFLAGVGYFLPILEGTPLEWLRIDEEQGKAIAVACLIGSVVLLAFVISMARHVVGDNVAFRVTAAGVETHGILGRRSLAWDKVGHAARIKSAIFLYPKDRENQQALSLPTMFTSVSMEDLRQALMRYRPGLFNEMVG